MNKEGLIVMFFKKVKGKGVMPMLNELERGKELERGINQNMRETLQNITASGADQQRELLEKYFIDAKYIIVGRAEYDALIREQSDNPMFSPEYKDGLSFLGMRIVPDFDSPSRVTVAYDVGLINHRKKLRADARLAGKKE